MVKQSKSADLIRPSLTAAVAPPLGGFDEAEGYEAEPEIHDEAEIELKQMVTRSGRKGWGQEGIGDLTQQNRRQGLDEIDDDTRFRHRKAGS
jgi:hypothetical protein